jgi:hypothetical protein
VAGLRRFFELPRFGFGTASRRNLDRPYTCAILIIVKECCDAAGLRWAVGVGGVRTTWAGEGGETTMLKIEDFYALLTSDSGENALLAALRKLTEVTKVEEIVDPIGPEAPEWF